MEKYHLINNGVLAICAVLFVLFLIIVITDALKPMKCEPNITYKRKRVEGLPRLMLRYPSVLNERDLDMPVKCIFHAQEMVDVLGLKEASLIYKRSADGKTITLYKLDDGRTLRRVKEVA